MATKKAAYEAPAPASDKKKALDTALAQIEKTYGKGAVMRLGDRPEMVVDAIPTGSLALDAALGIGGVPRGRIIEVYGPESSGKTTLALHILAEAQKAGRRSGLCGRGARAWTRSMPPLWGWTSIPCWSPSRTPASRPWRSPTRWCAPAPSTWWWWTRWRP